MRATNLRLASLGVVVVVLVAACGSDPLTVSEYANQAELLVATMEADFASIDATWEGEEPTPERASEYWEDRLAIRSKFLSAVQELEPPPDIITMHDSAIDVFKKINAADEALAGRVEQMSTIEDHWQWVETPEGQAADAVLAEVFAFCRYSQDEFDTTEERAALEGVAWIPADMQEVVKVAFGCPPSAP